MGGEKLCKTLLTYLCTFLHVLSFQGIGSHDFLQYAFLFPTVQHTGIIFPSWYYWVTTLTNQSGWGLGILTISPCNWHDYLRNNLGGFPLPYLWVVIVFFFLNWLSLKAKETSLLYYLTHSLRGVEEMGSWPFSNGISVNWIWNCQNLNSVH